MKNIYNDVRHGTERNILIAVRSHSECLKRLRMVVYFEEPIEDRLSTLWDPFTMLSIAKGQVINDLREPLASIVFTMTGSTGVDRVHHDWFDLFPRSLGHLNNP